MNEGSKAKRTDPAGPALAASFALISMMLLPACGDDAPPVGPVDAGETADATSMDAPPVSCAGDDECDDGVFCNGPERCADGTCVAAEDPACGPLTCIEDTASCATVCEDDPDADDDGHDAVSCGGDDCDDTLPYVHPGADERPGSGIDEDCDGQELCYSDADGDGFRTEITNASTDLACSGPGEASEEVAADDCDDADASVHPLADEVVADGVDQDCDGQESCFADVDADGFRPDETSVVPSDDLDCFDPGEADDVVSTGDCDDDDPLRNPAAAEIVGDGVDQNCDGQELCYVDADADGYRPDATSTVTSPDLACDAVGEADYLAPAGDCADADAARHPGATETCNGVDDDCDGRTDQRFELRRFPIGWQPLGRSCGTDVGRCTLGRQQCIGGAWDTTCIGGTSPRAELCDGTVDDDCDGAVDNGCACVGGTTRSCGSDVGECAAGTQRCTSIGTWAACVGQVVPIVETCNGRDDDCNGVSDDEDATGCREYFLDVDGDGHGDRSRPSRCLCAPEGDYTAREDCVLIGPLGPCIPWRTDCNDTDPDVHPGAMERCDSVDWDCDGVAREANATGCTNYFRDVDGDGYGAGTPQCLCAPTPVYAETRGGDCCDVDVNAHPPPGIAWHRVPNRCGRYDYDCNGTGDLRWTNLFGCGSFCGPDDTDRGWISVPAIGAPDCGLAGFWNELCFPQPIPPFCFQVQSFRFQECR